VEGLGIVPGQVRRFDDTHLTVPHIGWNGALQAVIVRLTTSGQ